MCLGATRPSFSIYLYLPALFSLTYTSHLHGLKRLPKFAHHTLFSLILAWFEAPTKIRTALTYLTPSLPDVSLVAKGSVLCSPRSEVIASASPGGDALPCAVALFSVELRTRHPSHLISLLVR